MADSVALLGWDETPIRVVQDVHWLLDDRADSTNQVRVTTSLAEADGVDAEQELIFKERGFTISGVERDRAADEAVITADEYQAALADVVIVGFRPNSWTLTRAMNAVLDNTLWTLGEVNGTRYGRADFDEITALDALHFLARHQDAKLSFDSLRRRVNITQDHGTAHEYVFTYGRQLSNITKDVQQPVTTVIYPTMADDVKLPAVEDYGYYLSQGISLAEAKARFRKEEYWEDSRYEIEENMTRDAQKRLEEEAYPRTTYVLTAQATVDVEGADDFDLSELRLGDTVYVWDQEIDTKLSAEVTAVTTSSDQSQNELALSTLPASLGDSVSDRGYFGDSGKPSSGGPRRSGPQPKPSMPILEQVSDYGTAVTRWNGQDSEGNFETIPQRFGTLLTLVAPLTDGVIPSPNDSSQTFMGSDIVKRGGGTSNIGFNGYGEFAVWHQMRGWDGMTLSEFSEPLVVDVPPAWDPQPTVDKLDNLNDVKLPALEQDITNAVSEASSSIQDFENRWDAQWDDTIPALADRQDTLEGEITDGLTQVHNQAEAMAEAARDEAVNLAAADAQSEYDRLQELAERALSRAGDNVLEDPGFETEHWVDEWNGTGGRLVRTSANPNRTGDQLLVIEDGSPVDFEFPDINVELDQSYRMTIWYRTWASNLADLSDGESALVFYDSDTGVELAASEPLTVGSEYRRAQVVYTVPEGVQSIRPAIRASWPTGQVLFDDVSVREVGAAAEALRMAEVARQQAEAAHIAAGHAVDAAASAYDAASSKSTVHWSLSAPSGTADNSDDVWWRYELRNGRRVVIGQWFWDDGVWRETEIAEEWLPQVNIGTGTYGDMSGDRLEANTVKAGALAIMPDSQDFAPDLVNHADMWTLGDDVSVASSIAAENGLALRIAGDASSVSGRAYGPWIPAKAGDTIRYRFNVGYYTSLPDGVLRVYFLFDGSLTVGWTRVEQATSTGTYEGVFTVPNYVTESVAFGVNIDTAATNGGDWAVRDFDVRKQVKGVLIEPEGIKSPQVDTAELTASNAFLDNAMVNLIQGRMANFDEALIGGALLKDNSISTRHLVVADATNFAPEPGEYEAAWSFIRARVEANLSGFEGAAIALDNTATSNSQVRGPILAVHPGDTIYVGAHIGWSGSAPTSGSVYLRMEWFEDADSSRETYTTAASTEDASGWFEGTVTVPDYATHARFYAYTPADSDAPGARRIRSSKVRVQTGGELIVDGSIKARNLDVEEIFFDSAVGNTVAAGVGEFLELNADNFRANTVTGLTVQAGTVSGGRITGANIETTSSPSREIKINNAGIHGYNNNGSRNFHVDDTGHLTAENAWVKGHILADSARLIGELRVGRSGVTEGGIIPADNNSRIRLIGRLPDNMSANDTFTVGYTPYRHYGRVWGWTTVNYAVPTPFGGRIPMVTANMDETWQTARPGMILNTRSRSESSFVILWHTNIRQGPEDPRMSFSYFATWGRGTPSS